MKQTININRLRLNVSGIRSSVEGRGLAKQVADKLANSFRGFDLGRLPDAPCTFKVRVPVRSRPGDVANAVRSAIARGTSGLDHEKRRG